MGDLLGAGGFNSEASAVKRAYLKMISTEFADQWRVKEYESLFDYEQGKSSKKEAAAVKKQDQVLGNSKSVEEAIADHAKKER